MLIFTVRYHSKFIFVIMNNYISTNVQDKLVELDVVSLTFGICICNGENKNL